jgi:hypothetical protein
MQCSSFAIMKPEFENQSKDQLFKQMFDYSLPASQDSSTVNSRFFVFEGTGENKRKNVRQRKIQNTTFFKRK